MMAIAAAASAVSGETREDAGVKKHLTLNGGGGGGGRRTLHNKLNNERLRENVYSMGARLRLYRSLLLLLQTARRQKEEEEFSRRRLPCRVVLCCGPLRCIAVVIYRRMESRKRRFQEKTR